MANSNKKIKYTQAKVEKLEERIRELVAKLNKHSERLAVGKLPTKWHTPSQIEEDIGKERAKLAELQAELCKLKLQASEDSGATGSKISSNSDDEMGDDPEMGGGDVMGMNDEMGGNGEEDPDILDSGNWSLGEYSGGEVGCM